MSDAPHSPSADDPVAVKDAVSFAVHLEGRGDSRDAPRDDARSDPRVLAVLRPPDDPELPDVWGLPATTLRPGEDWEEALIRAGREKLGVTLEPLRLLAEGERERRAGGPPTASGGPRERLRMRVYEAVIRDGEPTVANPPEGRGRSGRGGGPSAKDRGRPTESGTRSEGSAAESPTQYADWRWTHPRDLRPAATRGSLCTALYLEAADPTEP